MKFCGFEPCFSSDAEILILGSFPSVMSRENSFYYGNPRNRFWKTLAKAFNQNEPKTIDDKKKLLFKNRIALWDIVSECEIVGSLDSNIKNYRVADLNVVLSNAHIKLIVLNGLKAAEIFKKNYRELAVESIVLPSTSPANVRFDDMLWLKALKN